MALASSCRDRGVSSPVWLQASWKAEAGVFERVSAGLWEHQEASTELDQHSALPWKLGQQRVNVFSKGSHTRL